MASKKSPTLFKDRAGTPKNAKKPPAMGRPGSAGRPSGPAKKTPASIAKPTGDGRYVVKRGDTLSGIAKKHGTSLAAILKLNPRLRANPNLIFRGTKVRLK